MKSTGALHVNTPVVAVNSYEVVQSVYFCLTNDDRLTMLVRDGDESVAIDMTFAAWDTLDMWARETIAKGKK